MVSSLKKQKKKLWYHFFFIYTLITLICTNQNIDYNYFLWNINYR